MPRQRAGGAIQTFAGLDTRRAPRSNGSPWRSARTATALLMAVAGLAACTRTGDLGRPVKPEFPMLGFTTAGLVGSDHGERLLSPIRFSDDEKELRTRAYRFLDPPRDDTPGSFSGVLEHRRHASNASLWSRLISDIEADRELIGPFTASARRVLAADRARAEALKFAPAPDPAALEAAHRRADQNLSITLKVSDALTHRIGVYSREISNLSLIAPDDREGPARAALDGLAAQAGLIGQDVARHERRQDTIVLARTAPAAHHQMPGPVTARGDHAGRGDIQVIDAPPIVEVEEE